jgi:hypothetical protein
MRGGLLRRTRWRCGGRLQYDWIILVAQSGFYGYRSATLDYLIA